MKIKVLLVDDHEMVKEGLKKVLEIDEKILSIDDFLDDLRNE